MSGKIVGDIEAVVAIRFAVPPGTTPEKAGQMLSQGGLSIPLGLYQYVRKIDVAIVGIDEPYTLMPPEDGGGLKLRQ